MMRFKAGDTVRRRVGGKTTWTVVALGTDSGRAGASRAKTGMLLKAASGDNYWTTRLDDLEVIIPDVAPATHYRQRKARETACGLNGDTSVVTSNRRSAATCPECREWIMTNPAPRRRTSAGVLAPIASVK